MRKSQGLLLLHATRVAFDLLSDGGRIEVRRGTQAANKDERTDRGIALMFGQTGGDYAGTITRQLVANDSTVPGVGTMRVTETMQVSYNPDKGDSGGPVFYPHPDGGGKRIALGTHVHSDDGTSSVTGDGWYSPYDRGDADMIRVHGVSWDYSLCVTASC